MINTKYFIIANLALILNSCGQKTEKVKPMEKPSGIEISNLNLEVKPGDDFFEYANGGWLKQNPMPDEYSRYGAFEILEIKKDAEIKNLIEEVAEKKDLAKGSPEQQIRDYYQAAMDTIEIDKLGIKPLVPILDEIKSSKTKQDLIRLQAKLNILGSYPFFVVFSSQDDRNSTQVIANLNQGGIGLPERDYYTNTDKRSAKIRDEYVNHIQKMLILTGFDEKTATSNAAKIMKIETVLAQASMTMIEQRDPIANYNIYDLAKLQNNCKGYDFASYFNALGLTNTDHLNVHQPAFFMAMAKLFKNTSIEDIQFYLIWNFINSNASKLSSDFEKQDFYFNATVMSGVDKMKPRWKRMVSSTSDNLSDPVGRKYVEKYFPAASKELMLKLVDNLRLALKESIANLDWMSDSTKMRAQEKLAAITVKIGYPNQWIDYTSIEIMPNTFVENTWNCHAFEYKRNLAKIGKPVDREEWGMSPQTVNAYYNPNMNEIVFPAAILQAPFFDPKADDAVNYGAIGVVIGHEMTHGFDDQGRLYDQNGNLNDWWTEYDAKNFKNKTQILINQYNAYTILDSMHVNGELTLGENIADNGGLFISYAALQKSFGDKGQPALIDSLSADQRFLISYAQIWRQHIRPKTLMRRLQEDVHSPGEARVNAGVANLPWWYTAFKVSEGDKNYVAPEQRAKIW
jgi:putative endopeptidase